MILLMTLLVILLFLLLFIMLFFDLFPILDSQNNEKIGKRKKTEVSMNSIDNSIEKKEGKGKKKLHRQ